MRPSSGRLDQVKLKEGMRCAALKGLIDDLSSDEFVMATTSPGWQGRTKPLVNATIAPASQVTWLTNLR